MTRFQRILVCIDFSNVTPHLLETTRALLDQQSGVLLLHVAEPEPDFVGFDPGPQTVRTAVARDIRADHALLEQLKSEFPEGMATALQVQGPTAIKILQEAKSHSSELIVLGSHGHGALYHLLMGTVTSAVLREARVPVLVVPAQRK